MPPVSPQKAFRDPVTGDLVRLTAVGSQLTLTCGAAVTLAPLGEDSFQDADGSILRFTRKAAGAAAFSLTHGVVSQSFVAVRPAADPIVLVDYVGSHYCAELDALVTVAREGDALVMRQRFAVEWPLTPSFADAFTTRLRGVTTFVFARDAEGKVTGFGAWAGGARNIAFVRR